jgi:acyl-CoA thioesterase-1
VKHPPRIVLFFGDSLTAGHSLAPEEAYPSLIQRELDRRGRDVRVVNAGVSGDKTADGLARLEWSLAGGVDVFLLALGANDGLHGLPVATMERNLREILRRVRSAHPAARVVLAGMKLPPDRPRRYRERFESVYPALARSERATFIPFLLEGVGGIPALNQEDGLHPTAEGQRRMARTVWRTLEPLLRPRRR